MKTCHDQYMIHGFALQLQEYKYSFRVNVHILTNAIFSLERDQCHQVNLVV